MKNHKPKHPRRKTVKRAGQSTPLIVTSDASNALPDTASADAPTTSASNTNTEPTTAPAYKLAAGCVLVMRVCAPDLTSHGGTFRYPESGPVEASDWRDDDRCGGGLHGWLWGAGNVTSCSGADRVDGARWLVLEVAERDIRHGTGELTGKCKFPRGNVVYCGEVAGATSLVSAHAPFDAGAIIYGTATAGDGGTATAGSYGTATAGDGGTATAGSYGTATAGDGGTATAGYGGTATAGSYGTATAGDRGTATAGDGGTATAGYGGTATAGDGGTATAGYGGTATAGNHGAVVLKFWNSNRYITLVGNVGIDGIEANTPYVVRDGKIVRKP